MHELNGMFAFAIWDTARRSLFLARDRMGVKPLYYAETADGARVRVGDQVALRERRWWPPKCREEALTEYLLFRQVAGTETLFRGVKSLPPGCTMTVRDGEARISRATGRRDLSPSDADVVRRGACSAR